MTIDHSLGIAGNNVAWFLLQRSSIASTAFTISDSTSATYFWSNQSPSNGPSGTFDRYGQWRGYGVASTAAYNFQIGVCDHSSTSVLASFGIHVSGYGSLANIVRTIMINKPIFQIFVSLFTIKTT
jgi:hypothetical protein